ncbi:MAG: hypothetical protein LUD15_09890, partial [Bacteroides sp.]|nr:hypothetical protein [Bacteroides sp.]
LWCTLAGILVFAACSNEEPVDMPGGNGSGDTRKIYLKFNLTEQGRNARSVEDTGSGTKAALLSAMIYFVDNSADPVVLATRKVDNFSGADATIAEISQGKQFTSIPENVKKVYVVGNYNSSDADGKAALFPELSGIKLSEVKATLLDIEQVVYGKLADGSNSDILLTILDGEDIVKEATAQDADEYIKEGDLYARIILLPANSRIEMEQMKYEGYMKSLVAEGIYINYYYNKMNFTLNPSGASLVNNGSDEGKYDTSNDAEFAYKNSSMYDEVNATITTGSITVAPSSGVWAYHIFGNQAENAWNDFPVPHMVIKFTDVTDSEDNNRGNRYITVKGFRDKQGNVIQSLQRGSLYKIESLTFDDSHLGVLPEEDTVDVWIVVDVKEWTTVPVSPII